jgi:ketosteroid isomerase-like protein
MSTASSSSSTPRSNGASRRPLPWGGWYRGPQEVLGFLGSVGEHVDDLGVEVDEYLDCGASVVALGRVRGRSRATGEEIAVGLAHVWRLREGRVVWFYNYVDTAALLAALGGDGPIDSCRAGPGTGDV